MRQIVDNLLYDTNTAVEIYNDRMTHRVIYVTPNGHYFTLYPNGEIVPKTKDSLKEFLAKTDVDKYIEIFGVVEDA